MSSNLLNHPVVVAAIVAIVRSYGVTKKADVQDAVADVQLRALESFQRRPAPEDEGAMRALCAKIAENYCINRWKKQAFRGQYDMGLCVEDLDDHGPLQPTHEARDPVDEHRQLEALADLFREGKMPEHGVEILRQVSDGATFAEIGKEVGLTADNVEWRLRRMRRLFKARLTGMGLVASDDPVSPELAVLAKAA